MSGPAFLTVLTTRGINAVKTYTYKDGKVEVEGYGRAKTFTASEIELDDRGRWLTKMRAMRDSFVVLGKPVNWKPGEKKRRLSSVRDGDEPTIEDTPREWMPIDIDHLDFEPLAEIDDGEMLALELLDRLGIRGIRCVWHLTNSHGYFNKHRCRLWVQLKKPATCAQMKEFAKSAWGERIEVDGKPKTLVDLAVYRPAQPIYTGDPILQGVNDVVTKRHGFIDGDLLKIKVKAKAKAEQKADEIVEKLQEAGVYIGELRPGQHMIHCPWESGHSTPSKDDDTFYFAPHFNGHDAPAFVCHHGSCDGRTIQEALVEIGAEVTASEFTVVEKESSDDDDQVAKAPAWVYVHRLKSFWDARDGALVDTDAYNSSHGAGKGKKGTPTELFLSSSKTHKADIAEFLPGRERIITRGRLKVLNTYTDMRVEPDSKIDPGMWVDHLEWLIPDERDRERLCDWMAWAYQKPGQKITWAPILYGASHGTGKTTVLNCLAACIGPTHVSEPTQAELEEKFNDWCFGKLLVKIEELMSGDKFHVAEKLKPIVANPTVSIRSMHKTGFSVPNVANVCASTNHIQALPIEKSDRRYMIIETVEADTDERRPRMRAFHAWLEQVGYGGIAYWLASRDVSQFVPTSEAPMTRIKQVIAEASRTDFERAVDLCDVFDNADIVSSAMLSEYLSNNDCSLRGQRLGLLASRRKWIALPGRESRVVMGGRRVTLWSPTGNKSALKKLVGASSAEREKVLGNIAAKLVFGSEEPAPKMALVKASRDV